MHFKMLSASTYIHRATLQTCNRASTRTRNICGSQKKKSALAASVVYIQSVYLPLGGFDIRNYSVNAFKVDMVEVVLYCDNLTILCYIEFLDSYCGFNSGKIFFLVTLNISIVILFYLEVIISTFYTVIIYTTHKTD